MTPGGEQRDYHSPLRDRRAAETRRLILAAAHRLIIERGYGTTTMRDIAAEAGVAVQTIYSSIGSKRDLLSAFIDQMEDDANVEGAPAMFLGTENPREHLLIRAYWSRRIFSAGIETSELLINSLGTSPEIQELIEEGNARHRRSVQEWIVDRWQDDVFRDVLSRDEALDIISTMSGIDVYRWLVRQYGWPPEQYETWLYQSLIELVLSEKYRT
ncbi:TetR/AcrR family transcriptional regulator [soil metagenome]